MINFSSESPQSMVLWGFSGFPKQWEKMSDEGKEQYKYDFDWSMMINMKDHKAAHKNAMKNLKKQNGQWIPK